MWRLQLQDRNANSRSSDLNGNHSDGVTEIDTEVSSSDSELEDEPLRNITIPQQELATSV